MLARMTLPVAADIIVSTSMGGAAGSARGEFALVPGRARPWQERRWLQVFGARPRWRTSHTARSGVGAPTGKGRGEDRTSPRPAAVRDGAPGPPAYAHSSVNFTGPAPRVKQPGASGEQRGG